MLKAQDIIIQPPIFTPFECTEFYKLFTGSVTNFTQKTFETQLLIQVDYTSPSGVSARLADGLLTGNPSVNFAPSTTLIDNATYERIYPNRKITFYNKEIENLLARTKCLPPGQYDVCLTLYPAGTVDVGQNIITQTCYTRDKESLSQLLLVSPFEEDIIKVPLPLFTWTAVTPFNTEAMYRIQVVEMLANQTPYQAFRANPIFFEQKGLKSNILQYPISARSMPPCTQYAWRVAYELEGGFGGSFAKAPDFLQESEVWTFSTPCEEEEEEIKPLSGEPKYFYKPSPNRASQYHEHKEKLLRFEIDNPYMELPNLHIQFIDDGGNVQAFECCSDNGGLESSDDDARPVKDEARIKGILQGKNYITLDLDKYNLSEGKTYRLVIKDFKTDLFVNFKYEYKEKLDISKNSITRQVYIPKTTQNSEKLLQPEKLKEQIQEVIKSDVVSYHILFRVLPNPYERFDDLKQFGPLFRETFDAKGNSRYLIGNTNDINVAKHLLEKVKKAGYPASFVAEYVNGTLSKIIQE